MHQIRCKIRGLNRLQHCSPVFSFMERLHDMWKLGPAKHSPPGLSHLLRLAEAHLVTKQSYTVLTGPGTEDPNSGSKPGE